MDALTNYCTVAPRYQRAINLAVSSSVPESLSGYIITPNIRQALERIIHSVSVPHSCRSFYLHGPYGAGKSSFSVFLTQLFSQDTSYFASAHSLLQSSLPALVPAFTHAYQDGFLCISITARKQAFGLVVCEGIKARLLQESQSSALLALQAKVDKVIEDASWKDSDKLILLLQEVSVYAQNQKFSGVLLVVDEAGKLLEYALQDKKDGEIYLFQQIAEFANHHEYPFLFLISLHQLFNEYVELADKTLRAEWNKVQERFESIQFTESVAATIRMVAEAIFHPKELPSKVKQGIASELTCLQKKGVNLPAGMTFEQFSILSERAWPLHPLSLLIMPYLFRTLGQNERSIFTYLSNLEPYSFQVHLNSADIKSDSAFVRPYHLYQFFITNFASSLAHQRKAYALLEAEDKINSHPSLSAQEAQLLASIGLFSIPGLLSTLGKGKSLLTCAMPSGAGTKKAIDHLLQLSLITLRRLDDSYRIWEGSDIDLDERIADARRHLKSDPETLLNNLKLFLPNRRYIARRHALKTGACRYFDVSYAIALNEAKDISLASSEHCGRIVVLLPLKNIAQLKADALLLTKQMPHLVIAIPTQMDTLLRLVEEMSCLQWVVDNTPELRDDRVARRELDLLRSDCSKLIVQYAQQIMDPRSPAAGNECRYIWRGKEQTVKNITELVQLLSFICDTLYPDSPIVNNELISRSVLSGAVTSARRITIEGILERSHQDKLGIKGFPPERSIYESILATGQVHVQSEDGTWHLQYPSAEDPLRLRPCLMRMESQIFNENADPVPVNQLFDALAQRPYGIPEGLHPLLFTLFYQLHRHELFLYRENSFLPSPAQAHFELLQRRPHLFTVSGIRLTGLRKTLIEHLAQEFAVQANIVELTKTLFGIMGSLPDITLRTKKIELCMAMAVRNVFLQSQKPEQLLFVDIPYCIGLPSFLSNEVTEEHITEYVARLQRVLDALKSFEFEQEEKNRNSLLSLCHLEASDAGWSELLRLAQKIEPTCKDAILSPFLVNLIRKDGLSSVRQVLSFISKKAFSQWSDADITRFPQLASVIGKQFTFVCNNSLKGSLFTEADTKKKQDVVNVLDRQLLALKKEYSVPILNAALQELLQNLEK